MPFSTSVIVGLMCSSEDSVVEVGTNIARFLALRPDERFQKDHRRTGDLYIYFSGNEMGL